MLLEKLKLQAELLSTKVGTVAYAAGVSKASAGDGKCGKCGEFISRGRVNCSRGHIQCYGCGEWGHRKNECSKKKASSSASGNARHRKKDVVCHGCGVKGHKRPDCPSKCKAVASSAAHLAGAGAAATVGQSAVPTVPAVPAVAASTPGFGASSGRL